MDQIKIGKFIAERRKSVGLTQSQLAEKLGVTDRAVSKWETGRAMPDSSIMLDLCNKLGISVNDLLCGEVVTMESYNKKLEENLLEMTKRKEEADQRLLRVEMLVASILILLLLVLCAFVSYVEMEEWLRIALILIGLVPVIVVTPFMIKIEQTAGYYECAECGHRYIPEYKSVFFSMHYGTTRYMRCPKCNKKSWQKKYLSK